MKQEYINHLHVENVGPFNKLDVDFSPDVNVIVGSNGTGKTSILRCITHCFTNENREYFRYRVGARLATYFMRGEDQCRCSLIPYDLKEDQLFHERLSILSEREADEDGVVSYTWQNYPYNILAIGAHRYFDYVKIESIRPKESVNDQKRNYAQNNPLFIDKPLISDIKQWIVNRYFIIDKPWAKDLTSNWEKLLEKIPIMSSPNHVLSYARTEDDLNPIFELDGNECYLEELSSGFKSVLSVVISIISWIEGVNIGEQRKMENATGTVLIDEIEAHLHPAWQKKILSVVTEMFPKIQFIVTTHSPYIIASAEKNQIIMIPALSDEMHLQPIEKDFSAWRVEYILKELMGTEEIGSQKLKDLLVKLDGYLQDKNKDEFYHGINDLKELVHANDSILTNYEMRGEEIFSEE